MVAGLKRRCGRVTPPWGVGELLFDAHLLSKDALLAEAPPTYMAPLADAITQVKKTSVQKVSPSRDQSNRRGRIKDMIKRGSQAS